MAFTYRVDRSYDWNYEHGPVYEAALPEVPATPIKTLLGCPVSSRIGISAGLLLNSRWIELYSRLGFDVLTYKTVRSAARACYPLPNWVFLEGEGALGGDEPLVRRPEPPADTRRITSSVSFGMPSKDVATWQADIARARDCIGDAQLLIVSVVASPGIGASEDALVDDFGHLAALAREAGAQAVEANLSCPNVCTAEGQVYLDDRLSRRVSHALREGAGDLPLLLKAGHFVDPGALDAFLRAVAGAVSGIVLVNGLSRPIIEPDGSHVFGPERQVAGVLGHRIHAPCLANVRHAVATSKRERLDLEILAVGGVLDEAAARAYFEAGASAVLMGGAPMFDPELAVRFKRAHPEW